MTTTATRSGIEERLAAARDHYASAVAAAAAGRAAPELTTLREAVTALEEEARTWSDVQQEAKRQARGRAERETLAERTAARERSEAGIEEFLAVASRMDDSIRSLGADRKRLEELFAEIMREIDLANSIDWRSSNRVRPSAFLVLNQVRLALAGAGCVLSTGAVAAERTTVLEVAEGAAQGLRNLNRPKGE